MDRDSHIDYNLDFVTPIEDILINIIWDVQFYNLRTCEIVEYYTTWPFEPKGERTKLPVLIRWNWFF